MATLHTPREVLQAAYMAASKPDAPPEGMGLLKQIVHRVAQRGLMDVWMSQSSIDALMEEEADRYLAEQAAELKHVQSFESH